jgi:pilus assembly protein CpaC
VARRGGGPRELIGGMMLRIGCYERGESPPQGRKGGGPFAASGVILLLAAVLFSVAPALADKSDRPARKPTAAQPAAPLSIYHVDANSHRIAVKVTINKSETVRVDFPFSEALVGNPEIGDVVPLTNRSIYILGKKIGVTRLSLLDERKQMLGIVDVEVTHDMEALRDRLANYPEFADVKVSSVNGKMLLTGTAPDAVAMQRVVLLAEQIAPGDVTNAMSVAAPQQVMLEVRFIEAQRSSQRGVGINWVFGGDSVAGVTGAETVTGGAISSTSSGLVNNLELSLLSGLVSNAVPFGTLVGNVLNNGVKADVVVRALEERGLARRLAEPNLVALSGDTASFLAGGEFPFPVSAENDKVSVEFKKFGIGLAFTPTVLNAGQINLKIEPEVSELDPTNFVKVGTYEIPSLVVRRASTTIELRDGQSFAIAGLLQGSHTSGQRQLPWIGDVPVLGALFRSASFQKRETDLVIIVTPRLVKPRVPGQKLATPLDNAQPANDKEFFLRGLQEVSAPSAAGPLAGHILDYTGGGAVVTDYKGGK